MLWIKEENIDLQFQSSSQACFNFVFHGLGEVPGYKEQKQSCESSEKKVKETKQKTNETVAKQPSSIAASNSNHFVNQETQELWKRMSSDLGGIQKKEMQKLLLNETELKFFEMLFKVLKIWLCF